MSIPRNLSILAEGASASGVLGVANGGTGGSTIPPAGAIAYGNGTVQAYTAVGSAGQILASNGSGTPVWTTPVVATDNSLLWYFMG